MHDTETDVSQPNKFRQAGLVAAASVIGGLDALAEVAASEARRRHRGNRNHRNDDRKEERREERREDRQDDREHDRRHQNSRDTQQEEHPRREAVTAPNTDEDHDGGGNNHLPEQATVAVPFAGSGRAPSRLDYPDQPQFLS